MTLLNGGKEAWFLWQWDTGPLHGPAQGQWNKRRLAMIDLSGSRTDCERSLEETSEQAFVKEGEETETLPDRPVSGHPNDVTREGLEQIELALQLAPKAYAAAQEAYDRATLAMASRDLRYWTARRGSAVVIPDPSENSLIRFGHTVTIIREDDRRQTFRIVGEDEADPKRGTISHVAPRARARFGKGLGTQQGIIQARDCRSLFENVCVGSISDLCARRGDVCFTPMIDVTDRRINFCFVAKADMATVRVGSAKARGRRLNLLVLQCICLRCATSKCEIIDLGDTFGAAAASLAGQIASRNESIPCALKRCTPGDNRPEWGSWTQLILPVSDCDTNASVRADA